MDADAEHDDVPAAGRRPRLADVAARAGVSLASASLVLRDQPGPGAATRRRVLDAASELGYRPDRTASSLARRRSRLLGVLMDVRNPFHADQAAHLQDSAEQAGYDVVLSTLTATRGERRAVDTLLDFRCEALVLLGPELPVPVLADLGRTLPVVVVGRRLSPLVVDVVRSADDVGVAAAVDHLVDLGHREIAYVDGGTGTIAADRRRGFRSAMRRRGLGPAALVLPGDHTESAGIRAAATLLEHARLPTAVHTFNDRSAIGLVDALHRAGVPVPDRVSVVGYDDSPAARLAHAQLTTVSQNSVELADRAVEVAIERLSGDRSGPRDVVLAPHLVVRRTTGPAPGSP